MSKRKKSVMNEPTVIHIAVKWYPIGFHAREEQVIRRIFLAAGTAITDQELTRKLDYMAASYGMEIEEWHLVAATTDQCTQREE